MNNVESEAVGQPVINQMACERRGTGVLQFTLFDKRNCRMKQESATKIKNVANAELLI
ncbi:MAG: hypothetical protein QNJ70_23685 [Xenococcaceae cyanobacterium MO_207.B15]|nr:hypothetical protein [Xenococcaceae cyanobacterium MO_207.B15]